MICVDFKYEDYTFESVEEDDLEYLGKWIKENNEEDRTCYSLDPQVFYRRYLEYYVADDECFVKVIKEKKLIAVFKGRLEKKNELFIWLFIIDKKLRNKGEGSIIINRVIDYFKEKYFVDVVRTGVVESNIKGLSFWNSLGFDVSRIAKNFFDGTNNDRNLVIMNK
ncbi:GNAT family N-acetyltransferase [Clostridium sp. SHJSY1]|uniref:GNAT family N-acetyltransferase n=1 Tax=Clostridium sp. SHJSY1 TaxID=2942483 RepID=UPI00287605C4|nr:GNAT family N-acetyltransferase [Clostridium sp. SHJSY1]MDS0528007.1 GNAT family N-acetyltransferase [Clostridium sp. SHJSY1]